MDLPQETLAAIGALAIRFNTAEQQVSLFSAALLGIPEWKVAEALTGGTFGSKLSRLQKVAAICVEEHKPGLSKLWPPLQKSIGRLTVIAEHRNAIVHKAIRTETTTGIPIVHVREKPFPLRAEEVQQLVKQLEEESEEFLDSFLVFQTKLVHLRAVNVAKRRERALEAAKEASGKGAGILGSRHT